VEVTRTSASDEVGSAFTDLMLGVLMVIIAFPCLYYNEKRQVHMDKIFDWAEPRIRDVSADKVDGENQASPVCVQGETDTSETLRDDVTGVEVTRCVKITRNVEMYCWIERSESETRDTSDGGKETITRYSYEQGWSSSPQESSSMKEPEHENPPMPFGNDTKTAKKVTLGAFQLDTSLVEQMSKFEPSNVQAMDIAGKQMAVVGNGTLESGGSNPQVGDLRITVSQVPCGPASVASIQSGDGFQPLTYALVPSGTCCSGPPDKVDLSTAQLNPNGGDVEVNGICTCIGALIESGECIHNMVEKHESGKNIINGMRATQGALHFAIKVVSWFLFMVGFYFIFKFPPSIFRFIPFIGTWIQSFGNAIAFVAAFFLGTTCWCITVAVSLMIVKPMRGILFLGVAACLLLLPTILGQSQSN
jgi:hypothetical protein